MRKLTAKEKILQETLEFANSEEYLFEQAAAIEKYEKSISQKAIKVFDANLAERSIQLLDDFTQKVLYETNLKHCAGNMFEIASKLKETPELVKYCPAHGFARLLETHLLKKMLKETIAGGMTDTTMFLYRYLQKYTLTLDEQKRWLYFAEPNHIRKVQSSQDPPYAPIHDLDLFKHFLNDNAQVA